MVEAVTQSISDLAINFGEGSASDKSKKPMSRPFGCSLLIAGIDEKGPQLYQTDPSGTYLKWEARAIGSAAEGAQGYIQEMYNPDMTIDEAKKQALQILKNVMEMKITKYNVEVAALSADTGKFEIFSHDHVQSIIETLS